MSPLGAGSLAIPADACMGLSGIDYQTPYPDRSDLRVYFNTTDYKPNTIAMLTEGFPFLGVNLYAHIDFGGNTRLRNVMIGIIKKRAKAVYKVIRELGPSVAIEIEPFSDEVSKKFRRAQIIVKGRVTAKAIEQNNPYDYELKKWILDVKVNEVYKGEIKEDRIKAKCGTLSLMFGNGVKVDDEEFIFLMTEKSGWENAYPLIGTQPPLENTTDWLRKKFAYSE